MASAISARLPDKDTANDLGDGQAEIDNDSPKYAGVTGIRVDMVMMVSGHFMGLSSCGSRSYQLDYNSSSDYRFKEYFAVISIGELSKRTGVKVPTIRYCEQMNLIAPPERTAGNQRRYSKKGSGTFVLYPSCP